MARTRRKFDEDFKAGAVRIVRETGKPIAQVARELGINEGTLGNWFARDRRDRGVGDGALTESERVELERLRRENAELPRSGRCCRAGSAVRSCWVWSPGVSPAGRALRSATARVGRARIRR